MLRCQFMFSKQCSEAPFTCHINALILSRGTKVLQAGVDADRYFTAERIHCIPVCSKMDCRVQCTIEIICFWSNNRKAFHSLQHHPFSSSLMEQHRNLNRFTRKEDYFFVFLRKILTEGEKNQSTSVNVRKWKHKHIGFEIMK